MRTEATPLRVLILEDNPDHAELIVHQLRRAGFLPEWRRVETEQDYLKSLDPAPSLILADYHLPRFNALHALDLTRARGLETPFIVVSGLITEEAAAECLKRGANDYLLKDRLARLGQAITNALEKQQVQANLRRAEEVQAELAAIVESSDDAIVSTELDGTIVSWNRGAERMYGYSVAEMIGRNISVLAPPERADEIQRNIGKLKTGARIDHFETVRVRKDGQRVDISITIFPLKDAAAVITGMGAITRDITEKKRAEKLLQQQREALMQAEKLAAMGSLLAGVAHELNNPLAIVSAHLHLLQQSVGGGPLAERVEKIIDAAERCAQLVRTFTALARQDPPERRPVKLDQIAQEAVKLLTYQLQVDSVEVTTDLADDVPFLWADSNQLHQVIINVLSNAHQAVRECPLPRRIRLTIRFDPSQSRVTLEVADNGPGVPAEIKNRVFEPFFTTKPPGQGTGLGLSLCKGIIDAHGGVFRLDSRPGEGALALIELPVTPLVAPFSNEAAPSPPAPCQVQAILIVDDEPEIAAALADLLTIDGHCVETAPNGARALDKLGERSYDLIISDIRMPELDGPDLYREVQRRHPALRSRIIFMTGDTLHTKTREFLEKTSAPTVTKPFALDDLRRVIQRLL